MWVHPSPTYSAPIGRRRRALSRAKLDRCCDAEVAMVDAHRVHERCRRLTTHYSVPNKRLAPSLRFTCLRSWCLAYRNATAKITTMRPSESHRGTSNDT